MLCLQPGEWFRYKYRLLSLPITIISAYPSNNFSPSYIYYSNTSKQVVLTNSSVYPIIKTISHSAKRQQHNNSKMPPSVEYLSVPAQPLDYESDPVAAMSTYARMMHSHTKVQMDAATCSARRRSSGSSDAQTTLSPSTSISSNSSRTSF